ncbi:leucine-rich repeat-containing protein 26 isoform X3 [Ahaetulla prasina]|uniref:leucine-rich repeat-containing protein 26 isoform X3 n=1 Tax=Ahaetulla prasina TaxID=499056 RepID=UPI002649E2FC|nr:leucine-rich repeat-containing protein 26 isoform X3 [Ahaetulla prasina]
MWSLSKGGPERPMASSTWTLLLLATDHRSCPGGRRQSAFTVLTFFLFLPCFPASGCPDVCSCSLGKVNCVDRRLRFVPFQLPTNATALLLDYNRIAILRNGTFAAQKILRRLTLGNNVLASIHRLALVGLHELQDLDLSDNSLSLLHPEIFLPVPTLRTLKLGNNRLLRLEPELPRALPHLRALFVHSNALTSLPAGFFESLPSLSYLTLEDNPWTCSCGIRPLFLWLVKNRDKVPEANSVTCKRRASLTQYPISALGNESFARCQAPRMHLPDYAFFLLIGPLTFLACICVGILLGSLAVAHLKRRRTGSCIWPRAPVRHAGTPLRGCQLPGWHSQRSLLFVI